MEAVFALLGLAGWMADLRNVKLAVLDQSGREYVMAVAGEGRSAGVVASADLSSKASWVPSTPPWTACRGYQEWGSSGELKDFVERVQS